MFKRIIVIVSATLGLQHRGDTVPFSSLCVVSDNGMTHTVITQHNGSLHASRPITPHKLAILFAIYSMSFSQCPSGPCHWPILHVSPLYPIEPPTQGASVRPLGLLSQIDIYVIHTREKCQMYIFLAKSSSLYTWGL